MSAIASRSARALLLFTLFFTSLAAFAQFTGNIQGVIHDETGAAVAKAKITLLNTATQVVYTTTSDDAGNYRFVSLAPDPYKITVEAPGFATSEANVTLLTEQNLNVPVSLKVGATTTAVTVTAESPIVDTADHRN